MKTQNIDPLSIGIFILKTLWIIIGFITNLTWWILAKLPKPITFGLIPLSLLYASGYNPPKVETQEKAIIIFDAPTPKEQRLADLRGTKWDREDIDWYIGEVATEYGVSESYMHKIIQCESNYVQDVQSRHLRPDGSQEKSYGLSQIFLPAHPHVSYEEAIDPEFAIDFLGENLSKGRSSMWSCSRMI